ncbi:hypothetical protein [Mucilaginibacter sp. BT774]|uniref:hypothetical protein n=1 Tax=Mucilaginibacter sp. BT774 TaxID=3062276 RepID=UPI0026772A9E|nr:hypothetical protein [Mucilaginibacter sp. BT774]MDO3624568.1 hypothetical protein [Mucilaginibacter sp. BT774]
MKRLIIPFLLSGLILAIGANSVFAQIQLKEVTISSEPIKATVSQKVSEAFASLFKGAEAPKWYQSDQNYVVDFIMNNQINKAEFTKKGYLVYHMAFGNENQMPADIRTIVKSKYFDFTINSIVRITYDEKSAWIVNIEDAKQFLVVRVVDGVMDVVDKIAKTEV